jgi:transposase InsO family protein
MDVCGPITPPFLGGSRYMATYLDDSTSLSTIKMIKSKDLVAQITIVIIHHLETTSGQRLAAVRSDNGTEYLNSTLSFFFASKGVEHQTTTVYTPQHNGKAERLNRTLVEKARAMLTAADMTDEHWAEAATTANYLRNCSPTAGNTKTPWELFHGKKPDVSNLHIFGSTAFVRIPSELRTKLDPASQKA